MKHITATRIAFITALILTVSGCGLGQDADSGVSAKPSAHALHTPMATTAPAPVPGGKAQWLSILPDPAATKWDDSTDVAKKYTMVLHTWDSTIDRTDAYAGQRAAVWGTVQLQEIQGEYNPDQAKGQAYFNDETLHRTWTSATIVSTGRDGVPDGSNRDAITVNWKMTPHRRDATKTSDVTGTDDVLLYRNVSGRWQVQSSSTRQDVQ
jgi:hypothetical protein